MQWTDERIEMLKQLWGQGLTASQIAERLGGVSRNAVIGKAHRLGLSSRPSPIRGGAPSGPRPARKRASSAPRVAAAPGTATATATRPAEETAKAETPPPAPKRTPRRAATGGTKACMWPLGDPKEQNFHFCEEPAEPGRPYCAAHCAQAYQRRSEEAA